jgi:dienelactone hydrolase
MKHLLWLLLLTTSATAADKGDIVITADGKDSEVPERFRLSEAKLPYEFKRKYELKHSGVIVSTLTFPSTVKSPHESNNTVHAEYFQPVNAKNAPAVVVLDILDGAQVVSRAQALWLAQHDIPALIVYMAYYGPRRPADSKERLISPDVEKSVGNITQTIKDCRCAFTWLAARPEVDARRLGVLGTSLGSFVGGVLAGAEPRVTSACLLLGGGNLVESFATHPKAKPVLEVLNTLGIKMDTLKKLVEPVDPITYAGALKKKRLLLIGASRDDVVPPVAMKCLWEAVGQPKMLWIDETHVGAALHMIPMMRAVTKHLLEEGETRR